MQLCVLIFNSGSENEGIYTLNVDSENTVVAFESREDAERYANLLEAQDFIVPEVELIEAAEIKQFCEDSSLGLIVVEAGQLVIPPEKSKETLDWSPEPAALEPNSELERMRSMLEQMYRKSS
ncbi:DUF3110 domain-containing protein [Gloeobacter morelensis]|uniref:DUF3110 domain-containing protein n=1 Tax=Gloeobacter morelensis MG652769 TaxID=2781736 RepID=A0ABY3PPE3_9CYAN|nr:DUF3110 domain-containing protein [Gloeobacter morelensis]UFP95511.1 DUF3110 domain-containing protein [Gloeobacter morelensis MG652769]